MYKQFLPEAYSPVRLLTTENYSFANFPVVTTMEELVISISLNCPQQYHSPYLAGKGNFQHTKKVTENSFLGKFI